MVSEYQKRKKQPYSMYVTKRCRQEGVEYVEGFKKFAGEWKELGMAEKEKYEKEAKEFNARLKVECEGEKAVVRPISDDELAARSNWVVPSYVSSAHFPMKRTWNKFALEDGESSSKEYLPAEVGPKSEATPPSKRHMIGYDEGDELVMETDDSEVPVSDFDELEMSSVGVLWTSAIRAYHNIDDIREQHVFVFHAIPVIYAQGYKNGGNRNVNRPLEIAVSVFSLKNGLEKAHFSIFIDPGDMLEIHEEAAEESRKERHGIPHSRRLIHHDANAAKFYSQFSLCKEYYDTYDKLMKFCGFDGSNQADLLPLFAGSAEVATCEACLLWLFTEASKEASLRNKPPPVAFEFATLEDFAEIAIEYQKGHSVKKYCGLERDFIKSELRYDHFYKQLADLSCEYHQHFASFKECALGATRQATFMLLTLLTPFFDFPKTAEYFYMPNSTETVDSDGMDDEEPEPTSGSRVFNF